MTFPAMSSYTIYHNGIQMEFWRYTSDGYFTTFSFNQLLFHKN